jgi:hypothetical protein
MVLLGVPREGARRYRLSLARRFAPRFSLREDLRDGIDARDTSPNGRVTPLRRSTWAEAARAAVYHRVTFSFAAALEALRAPFKSRRIASGRVISLRFAHRSMALIVSVGSRTLINGPAFVPGQAFLDWTVFFGIADPLLNRVFEGYIRQPIVPHKRSSEYRRVGLSEVHYARPWTRA